MIDKNRDNLVKDIENHLRLTTRQLLKFDTEEEVLQYLIDAFQSRLKCNFVAVILKQNGEIMPKVWSGGLHSLKQAFPIKVEHCSPKLFKQSMTYKDKEAEEPCYFLNLLKKETLKTWFTVPIQDEKENYGFCTIGFLKFTHLFEIKQAFDEFGKDVATALSLARQKRKKQSEIMSVDFIVKNLSLNESIENLVGKIVEQAGKVTKATFAGIYLYNEEKNYFIFQPPSFGKLLKQEKIIIKDNYMLKEYFPFLELHGGNELTIPLTLDLKILGVLHVENKEQGVFSRDDLDVLTVMAEHVSALLRNAFLYKQEKERMIRLQSMLDFEQKLIKKTIEEEEFHGITELASQMFRQPVILFDRFFRVISAYPFEKDEVHIDPDENDFPTNFIKQIADQTGCLLYLKGIKKEFILWPVNAGKNHIGYLAIEKKYQDLDAFDLLEIDLVRNIFSVQFIKQKLVFDSIAQVKENLIDKLLVEQMNEMETVIQYANLFQWDLYKPHRVAVLSVFMDEEEPDIFEREAKKSLIFDELKAKITQYDQKIIFTKKGEEYVLIIPSDMETPNEYKFWKRFVEKMKGWLKSGNKICQVKVGIGGTTNQLQDYYKCYQQAVQTLNVILRQDHVSDYAFFDDLGSYTLLHLVKDTTEAKFFMNNYLNKLKDSTGANHVDLLKTLRVYLEQNGSIKKTAEKLFIHRSTLLYRLEKIKEIVGMDIDDSDTRFNLMLTFKLYDLQQHGKKKDVNRS